MCCTRYRAAAFREGCPNLCRIVCKTSRDRESFANEVAATPAYGLRHTAAGYCKRKYDDTASGQLKTRSVVRTGCCREQHPLTDTGCTEA